VDDLPVAASGGRSFIGPLTMAAVIELIYRVKSINFLAHMTRQDEAPGDPSATIDVAFDYDFDATVGAGIGELEIFEAAAYSPGGGSVYSHPIFYESGEFDPGAGITPMATEVVPPDSLTLAEIFVTPAGDYYLAGVFGVGGGDGDYIAIGNSSRGGLFELIDASIVLSSGTFPVAVIAESAGGQPTSSSLTLTATEWFPFATTAGAAAWDTTTGAPANGGPGA